MSRGLLGAATVVVALSLLPLAGLVWGVLQPPVNVLAPPASFGALWAQSHAAGLLARTLALALSVCAIAVPLGSWLAWVEQRSEYRGRSLLAVLDLLPLAVPSYLLAATLRESLGPGGAIGSALGLGSFTGFGPAWLTLGIVTTPYVQLLVASALAKSSASEQEAASLLGASATRIFRKVTLPRIRPAIAVAFVLTALYTISDFGAVAVLNCQVLTWRLYQAVNHQELARASILGCATLVATIPLLVAARLVQGRWTGPSAVANPRPLGRQPLGALTGTVTALAHTIVIGLGVALPVSLLATWIAQGSRAGLEFASLTEPFAHTAIAAFAGATFTFLIAIFPARATARHAARTWWIEQGTYATSALPGVMIGFGLLLFALGVARTVAPGTGLYAAILGSGVLLLLGYATRFVAEGYGPLKSAFAALDPRVEESARVLSASPWKRLREVLLPALAPGAAAAYVLLWLAVLKELPVTLLLGNATGLRTLSFRIYDRYEEAFLHDAGLAGLLLLTLALAGAVLTLRWRRHV